MRKSKESQTARGVVKSEVVAVSEVSVISRIVISAPVTSEVVPLVRQTSSITESSTGEVNSCYSLSSSQTALLRRFCLVGVGKLF